MKFCIKRFSFLLRLAFCGFAPVFASQMAWAVRDATVVNKTGKKVSIHIYSQNTPGKHVIVVDPVPQPISLGNYSKEDPIIEFEIKFDEDQTRSLIFDGRLPRDAQIEILGFSFDKYQELAAVRVGREYFPDLKGWQLIERLNREKPRPAGKPVVQQVAGRRR